MKIDPRIPANGELQNNRVKSPKAETSGEGSTGKTVGASKATSQDTFQLSSRHSEVQTLTEKLASVPEVRQEKIAPLQAKVQNGTYKPDSAKVADAILAEQKSKTANA